MMILNRIDSQTIDRQCTETYGIPGIVLMENAGLGIVDTFLALNPKGKILIVCGGGNNGGDGFVVARHLHNHGLPVQVLLCVDPAKLKGDAKINHEIVLTSGIPLTTLDVENIESIKSYLADTTWIVDALFGTGLQGEVNPPFNQIIQAINDASKQVLAIDIPSGLDCDTGKPLGVAIQAMHTITMVAIKKGFTNPKATGYLGDVHVVGIGAPRVLLERYSNKQSS